MQVHRRLRRVCGRCLSTWAGASWVRLLEMIPMRDFCSVLVKCRRASCRALYVLASICCDSSAGIPFLSPAACRVRKAGISKLLSTRCAQCCRNGMQVRVPPQRLSYSVASIQVGMPVVRCELLVVTCTTKSLRSWELHRCDRHAQMQLLCSILLWCWPDTITSCICLHVELTGAGVTACPQTSATRRGWAA